ncbi:MAG TPA: tetratricopeptide repeat protein [Cellvibrionaceae bacterium]|nr:tetratricopeptide repeat protein [Cellvibrionaceae bacterium]
MKYLTACGLISLLTLSGCASYDGPSQRHERFPDSPASSGQYPDSRSSEPVRVIASNRVTNRNDDNSDPDAVYERPSSRDEAEVSRRQPPATYNRPRPANAAPATNRAVSGALGSLVSQAQAAYQAGNYQTAISTAERGLRIDRRAPALYLVMAQSYLALNQPTQAAQFANQGLRFSQSGSAEARALEKVRNGAGE